MTEESQERKALPCPFCNGELSISKHFKEEMWSAIHRCKFIGPISFDWHDKVEQILNKWNTRNGQKALREKHDG
jgi:hypothetical protein